MPGNCHQGMTRVGAGCERLDLKRRSLGSPEAELRSEKPQFMLDHINPGDSKRTQNTNTKTQNANTKIQLQSEQPQFMSHHIKPGYSKHIQNKNTKNMKF